MTTLVTAIYGYGPTTLVGGRGRNVYFYNSSLRNISNLGFPIVIYSQPEEVPLVNHFVSQYFKDFKIIPYPLENFEYYQQFTDYKKTLFKHINLNDRNEILCYSKSYWVKDAIEKNFFNTDNFLWIDSGLTHHGIIPEKVGGVELMQNIPLTHYYPHNPNNIFNPTLGSKIEASLLKDKLFFCSLPFQGGQEVLLKTTADFYGKTVNHLSDHLIGGIFGGSKDIFLSFFEKYRALLKYFIDNRVYSLEEPIFSCLNLAHPELFDLHRFYTWYFYAPGERTHVLDREGDSFYKIFTKIYEK